MSSDKVAQRLADIVDNADRIIAYTGDAGLDAFLADQKTIDAVERCLGRLVEAIMKIGSDRMAVIAPDLPFERARGLGNMLRHEYDEIDLRLLFALIERDLPALRIAASRALDPDA